MTDKAENQASQHRSDPAVESAITRALEQPPAVAVPADFAARVRGALPARPPRRRGRSAARVAATAAAAASLVGLCWLAPHAAPDFQSMAFDMELALLAELAAIAAWLATQRGNT